MRQIAPSIRGVNIIRGGNVFLNRFFQEPKQTPKLVHQNILKTYKTTASNLPRIRILDTRVEIFKRISLRYKTAKEHNSNKKTKKFAFLFPSKKITLERGRKIQISILTVLLSSREFHVDRGDQPFQPLAGIPNATATHYVSLRLQHAWPRVSPNYQTRAWTRFEARKVQALRAQPFKNDGGPVVVPRPAVRTNKVWHGDTKHFLSRCKRFAASCVTQFPFGRLTWSLKILFFLPFYYWISFIDLQQTTEKNERSKDSFEKKSSKFLSLFLPNSLLAQQRDLKKKKKERTLSRKTIMSISQGGRREAVATLS